MLPIPCAQGHIPGVPGASQAQAQPPCSDQLPGQVKTFQPPFTFYCGKICTIRSVKHQSAKQVLSLNPQINPFSQGILLSSTLIFPTHILLGAIKIRSPANPPQT